MKVTKLNTVELILIFQKFLMQDVEFVNIEIIPNTNTIKISPTEESKGEEITNYIG